MNDNTNTPTPAIANGTPLFSKDTWTRGLYMLLFAVFWMVAELVLLVVAGFQFAMALFTGTLNQNARDLGNSLGQYVFAIAQFVTYNSDDKPYPFAPWPKPQTAPKAKAPRARK